MAQLNSSMVIWFMGISQIPGKDLDGHCLLPATISLNSFGFIPYLLENLYAWFA
jgi:hypothetical protein